MRCFANQQDCAATKDSPPDATGKGAAAMLSTRVAAAYLSLTRLRSGAKEVN